MIRHYYDPLEDMEITHDNQADPSWIPITEARAYELIEARARGLRVYADGLGGVKLFEPPIKPTVAWNETTLLQPFVVIDGLGSQAWEVTKISFDEQSALLGALRWGKQNSGRMYRDETGVWLTTLDPTIAGSIYIPTDALTMTTLMGIKGDFDNGIDIERDWKVGGLTFVSLTNAELAEAYKEGQRYWQAQFTIERRYAALIASGADVNIYEWSL